MTEPTQARSMTEQELRQLNLHLIKDQIKLSGQLLDNAQERLRKELGGHHEKVSDLLDARARVNMGIEKFLRIANQELYQ